MVFQQKVNIYFICNKAVMHLFNSMYLYSVESQQKAQNKTLDRILETGNMQRRRWGYLPKGTERRRHNYW